MNVKPGDLAIRVKALEDDTIKAGSIVKVIAYCGNIAGVNSKGARRILEHKGNTTNHKTGRRWAIPDSDLRPINNPDGEDETLTWAPVQKSAPNPVPSTVKTTPTPA